MLDWLKAILGDAYTEDIDAKVSTEIGKSFVSRSDFNNANEELKTAKATLQERDGQIETLKTSAGDNAKLLKQIETMQEENKTAAEAHAAEVKNLKVNAAVDAALANAGAKNKTAVRALLSDLDNAEIADDGTIKGLSEQITALAEGEDTSFLFSGNKPEISGASPASGADKTPDLARGSFEARYAEARKNNDNVSSIAIKREAAEAGVFL